MLPAVTERTPDSAKDLSRAALLLGASTGFAGGAGLGAVLLVPIAAEGLAWKAVAFVAGMGFFAGAFVGGLTGLFGQYFHWREGRTLALAAFLPAIAAALAILLARPQ